MNERVQYNIALAITGVIRAISQQKIYNELGLESLHFRRWFRRLCAFYKIKITQLPSYLYELIPKSNNYVQHTKLLSYRSILLQNRYIQIFLFSIYNCLMEQT